MSALAQGPDLCEIILLPSEELRFDSSDLDNWYYQFDVTADQASTNVYGAPRLLSEFQGLRPAAGVPLAPWGFGQLDAVQVSGPD